MLSSLIFLHICKYHCIEYIIDLFVILYFRNEVSLSSSDVDEMEIIEPTTRRRNNNSTRSSQNTSRVSSQRSKRAGGVHFSDSSDDDEFSMPANKRRR